METITIFEQGRNDLISFINNEYKGFDQKLLSHFLNSFNELLDYREEGTHTKPKIIFTNNIDAVIKTIPNHLPLDDIHCHPNCIHILLASNYNHPYLYLHTHPNRS